MNLSKGGAAALAGLFFVTGLSLAPDQKVVTVTKTDVRVVEKQRLLVVRDDERVVERIPAAFPGACTQALDTLDKVRALDAELDKANSAFPDLVGETQRVIVTGKAPDLVTVTERLAATEQTAANVGIARLQLLAKFDEQITECKQATTRSGGK